MLIKETLDYKGCPEPFYSSNIPLSKRIKDGVFQAILWIIWSLIMSPMLTGFAWYFGYKRFDVYIFHDWPPTEKFLFPVLLLIVISWSIIALWSIYNFIRFSRRNKRKSPQPIDEAVLANKLGMSLGCLKEVQLFRAGIVYYDEKGNLINIEKLLDTSCG